PESARYANYASGERRATGMSVFSVGGNLGIALGPVAISLLAGSGGVVRIVWMALPACLMAALLAHELPHLRVLGPKPRARAPIWTPPRRDGERSRGSPS
ncbi:MAG: MFS transporter, partial [Thermoanaerobaculia bacterium]